jgi:(p)ppGpp synthase/HD superfamily hydrolase
MKEIENKRYNRISAILKLAFSSTQDQQDKAGHPYMYHLLDVAGEARNDSEFVVALLHDYIEDGNNEEECELRRGTAKKYLSKEEYDAVVALTQNKREDRVHYIERVKSNKLASVVKLYDIKSNTNAARLALLDEKTANRLRKKYKRDIEQLKEDGRATDS